MKGGDRLEELLRRLKKFGKISLADYDYAMGKQSGYPECCIKYYMQIRSLGFPPDIISSLVIGCDEYGINYVRCPKCRGIENTTEFNRKRHFPNEIAYKSRISQYYS
jgi:hypothetical protein